MTKKLTWEGVFYQDMSITLEKNDDDSGIQFVITCCDGEKTVYLTALDKHELNEIYRHFEAFFNEVNNEKIRS